MTAFKVSGAVLANLAKMGAILETQDFAFTAHGDKLAILAGNSSKTAIVQATYPITDGPAEPLLLNHSVARFADKLDGLTKEAVVDISYVAPHMVMVAGRKKRVVATVDARTAQTPKPPKELPWTAHIEMPLAFLKDACTSNDDYTELKVRIEGGSLYLVAADELDTYEDSMAVGSEVAPCASIYTPKMLAMLLKPAVGDNILIHFGQDLPLGIDFSVPGGLARIYLAPRV